MESTSSSTTVDRKEAEESTTTEIPPENSTKTGRNKLKTSLEGLHLERGRSRTKQPNLPESAFVHDTYSKIDSREQFNGSMKSFVNGRDTTLDKYVIGSSQILVKTRGRYRNGDISPPPPTRSSITKKGKWRYRRDEDRKQKDIKQKWYS